MKNILILAAILFAASFSFIGCSDDPIESITGPTPIAGPQGDTGPKGETGETGEPGADGTGQEIPDGYHADVGPNDIFFGCLEGYHIHADSTDSICRTEVGGYDINDLDIDLCGLGTDKRGPDNIRGNSDDTPDCETR